MILYTFKQFNFFLDYKNIPHKLEIMAKLWKKYEKI